MKKQHSRGYSIMETFGAHLICQEGIENYILEQRYGLSKKEIKYYRQVFKNFKNIEKLNSMEIVLPESYQEDELTPYIDTEENKIIVSSNPEEDATIDSTVTMTSSEPFDPYERYREEAKSLPIKELVKYAMLSPSISTGMNKRIIKEMLTEDKNAKRKIS